MCFILILRQKHQKYGSIKTSVNIPHDVPYNEIEKAETLQFSDMNSSKNWGHLLYQIVIGYY